jgi:hypothetical protein
VDIRITTSVTGADRSIEMLRRLKHELPYAPKSAIKAGAVSILAASEAIIPRRTGELASSGRAEFWSQGDTTGATISYGRGVRYAVYAMFQRRTRRGEYKRTAPGQAAALFVAVDRLKAQIEASIRLAVEAAIRRIESG